MKSMQMRRVTREAVHLEEPGCRAGPSCRASHDLWGFTSGDDEPRLAVPMHL